MFLIKILPRVQLLLLIFILCSCSEHRVRLANTSIVEQPEVLIYGATPAGIISAVAASRQGRTVLLIEPSKRIGGIIAGGLAASDVCNEKLIGGLSLEFFQRIGSRYGKQVRWRLEPHVAEDELTRMLNEEGISVLLNTRIQNVKKENQKILSASFSGGKNFLAQVFIDASYEGDLLAKAGVAYVIGREAVSEFNESLAGRTSVSKVNQWDAPIDPFDESGQLLPGISSSTQVAAGKADNSVMAYNFRPCISKNPKNQVSFPRPLGYDAKNYQLLARYLALKPEAALLAKHLMFLETVRDKFDINSIGPMSTDFLNMSKGWAEASYADRERIFDAHKTYTQGLLYFLANDPQVPDSMRQSMSELGLCKDEFKETNNWPHHLYVRVGRRLRGEYVLKQDDLINNRKKPEAVGWGSCRIEIHHGQRILSKTNRVLNEGNVGLRNPPYQIPYGILVPKENEATNLLVPVAASATNVAYSSLRMEPVFMILGHTAGIAASLAIEHQTSVQNIDRQKLQEILKSQKQVI